MLEGSFSFVSELKTTNQKRGKKGTSWTLTLAEVPFNAGLWRLYFAACWSELLYLFIDVDLLLFVCGIWFVTVLGWWAAHVVEQVKALCINMCNLCSFVHNPDISTRQFSIFIQYLCVSALGEPHTLLLSLWITLNRAIPKCTIRRICLFSQWLSVSLPVHWLDCTAGCAQLCRGAP